MSIYKSDVPELVRVALDSLLQQTLLPNEIVIVGDGPVPAELEQEVSSFKFRVSKIRTTPNPSFAKGGDLVPEDGKESLETRSQKPATIVTYLPQEKNGGLGEAMRIAAEAAKYDYLARMDSDDICLPDRFEKQMKLEDAEIKRMMRGRCAVNHVTVIFKKADLMKSGNYQPFWKQEDHYLWARMMEHGCKFRNIPDVVVNVRSGKDQIARRGGLRFYKSVVRVFWYMYRHGLISFGYFLYICTVRGIVQVLMPNRLRTWVYLHLLRK